MLLMIAIAIDTHLIPYTVYRRVARRSSQNSDNKILYFAQRRGFSFELEKMVLDSDCEQLWLLGSWKALKFYNFHSSFNSVT